MAGDWIKLEHTTPDKPEIDTLAHLLNIDHDAAFGKCVRFWIWVDQQSLSGDALSVTESFLDRLTNCPGFAESLLKVGWLKSRNGRFSVPHFDRHNGKTSKNRALTKDRMARSRDADSVTNASPEIEKRRDKKDRDTAQASGIDFDDDPTPGQVEAWRCIVMATTDEAEAWITSRRASNWMVKGTKRRPGSDDLKSFVLSYRQNNADRKPGAPYAKRGQLSTGDYNL